MIDTQVAINQACTVRHRAAALLDKKRSQPEEVSLAFQFSE